MARKSGIKWLWLLAAALALGGAVYAAIVVAKRGADRKTASAAAGDDSAVEHVPDQDAPWEIVQEAGGAVAVPKDWQNLDRFSPQVLVFRKSNGKGGIPKQDEAGQELQAQMILEKIRMELPLVDSANVVAERLMSEPQTEVSVRPVGDTMKLADGTDAFRMSMELVKGDTQRHLIIKLLTKTDQHNGFVVTGTITASKDSHIAAIDSPQGKWLRVLVESLVLDPAKFDARKVNRAYLERDGK